MPRRARALIVTVAAVLAVGPACSSSPPAATGPSDPAGASSSSTGSTGSTAPTASTPSTSAGETGATEADEFDEEVQAELTRALVDARARFGFAGVLAGVWTPDRTWIASSGSAGPRVERAPQAKDHTRIGSITKTFTATLILQLVEDGRLALDDRINEYVPGLPNGATATIRQLLDMTSGIPSYTDDDELLRQVLADPNQDWLPNELVSVVSGRPALFEAGQGWAYSNTNAVVLGMVIEKITGQPVAAMLRERILVPLELDDTSLPANGLLPEPHLDGVTALGQPEGETVETTEWNPSWASTAGGMVSTLDDLHRWGEALGTGTGILRPETHQLRLDSFREDNGYGLGADRTDGWIGHDGDIPGYNTVVRYHPERRTTIVVMVNADGGSGESPAPAIFDALAPVAAAAG